MQFRQKLVAIAILSLAAAAFAAGEDGGAFQLAVRSVALPATQPRVGQKLAFAVTFENRGSAPTQAGRGYTCVIRANTGGGSCPVMEIDMPDLESIPPGGVATVVVSAGPATAPGSYSLAVDPLSSGGLSRGGVRFQVWPDMRVRIPILDMINAPKPAKE